MNKKKIIEALNEALAQEHACFIRYLTHAAVITGPYAEPIAARLKDIAEDEEAHAQKLRDRIAGLGGTPTMRVEQKDLVMASSLKDILEVNLKEEEKAIAMYRALLKEAGQEGELLFETIEHILQDEQEHKEELERLKG
jgi:bacterioferritin